MSESPIGNPQESYVLFCMHRTCTQNLYSKGPRGQRVSRNSAKVTQTRTSR